MAEAAIKGRQAQIDFDAGFDFGIELKAKLHGETMHANRKRSSSDKKQTRATRELEQKEKETKALALVQRLKQAQRAWKLKDEQQRKAKQAKAVKEAEEAAQKRQELEAEQRQKKRQESLQAQQERLEKKERERRKKQQHLSAFTPLSKERYLYHTLEKRYHQNVLMPLLEQKKLYLAQARNLHKSLTKAELLQHKRKYTELIANKEEERAKDLKQRKKEQDKLSEDIAHYQTKTYTKTTQLEMATKEEEDKRRRERNYIREKMHKYSMLVKEICPVVPSPEKASELREQIDRLKHPVRQPRNIRKDYEIAQLLKNRILVHHSASVDPLPQGSGDSLDSQHPREKDADRLKTTEEKKPPDYLTEKRKRRTEVRNGLRTSLSSWLTEIQRSPLKPSEKYAVLAGKVGVLDEKAKMQELLLKTRGGTQHDPALGDSLSDLFITAIKVKLAMLEQL